MSTLSTLMALKCSSTPAGWGLRGSCPNGSDHAIAQTPRLALTGLGKLDDLFGDRVTRWADDPIGALEDHKGHFESDAHETDRLGIKSMAFQVGPDWHGSGAVILNGLLCNWS